MVEKHILLVDDSSSVRQHLGSILKNADYQVTDAENGVQAIEKLKSGSFDLLFRVKKAIDPKAG